MTSTRQCLVGIICAVLCAAGCASTDGPGADTWVVDSTGEPDAA
jgi:hypothetical protein